MNPRVVKNKHKNNKLPPSGERCAYTINTNAYNALHAMGAHGVRSFSALAGPMVGDTFFLFSIKRVGASIATPLASTYSLMVAIMSVTLFGEKLTVLSILGGLLILSSV